MAPFDLQVSLGTGLSYLIFLLIGMGFGAVLEMSGFGDSRKLAAQFYLKDMTVLKVMFTGIIVAAALIFFSTSMGWLEYERVWVNPTYLWPGIVGGLIMGVGFVIGGFCPGTSLVASSTLKIDGIFFVVGVGFGIFIFGERVEGFETFFNSSAMGRFTVPEWLGLPTGVVLLLLILMALAMFYGAELLEQHFGRGVAWKDLELAPGSRAKLAATFSLVLLALVVAFKGQPSLEQRWDFIAAQEDAKLEGRAVYVHPGEVTELMNNASILVEILDVRPESDYNKFHLRGAKQVDLARLTDPELVRELRQAAPNRVIFVVSNDERDATSAYRTLRSQGVINLYIIDGGINHWLATYSIDPCVATPLPGDQPVAPEQIRYAFHQSVGARSYAAHPGCACKEFPTDCFLVTHRDTHARTTVTHDESLPKLEYTRKVILQKQKKPQGGCG